MSLRSLLFILALFSVALTCSRALAVRTIIGVEFTPLGDLPGGSTESWPHSVSADGDVIVGGSGSSSGFEAFRWTSSTGMVGLGDLPGGMFASDAESVSADGNTVVGLSYVDGQFDSQRAFRWTAETGMENLGDLPGGQTYSEGYGVSGDGSIVVGLSPSLFDPFNSFHWEAFRWTRDTGMVGLGGLPNEPDVFFSAASDISDDGTTIVGYSVVEESNRDKPFRWTSNEGMVELEPGFAGRAEAVSSDGKVIVGLMPSLNGDFLEAFRWAEGEGVIGLGRFSVSMSTSHALDVSADGSKVVGFGRVSFIERAFIWDQVNGFQDLREQLINNYGIDLTGWTMRRATGISSDGYTIVGAGTNPAGKIEGWRVHFVTVPEPSTFALMLLAVVGVMAMRPTRKTYSPNREV